MLFRSDGVEKYDIEFYHGNKEYDYEIKAADGTILEYDQEIEDYTIEQTTTNNNTTSSNGSSNTSNNVSSNSTTNSNSSSNTNTNTNTNTNSNSNNNSSTNNNVNGGWAIHFNSKMTDLEIKDDKITAIEINHNDWVKTNQLVLAIGHSEREKGETGGMSVQKGVEGRNREMGWGAWNSCGSIVRVR